VKHATGILCQIAGIAVMVGGAIPGTRILVWEYRLSHYHYLYCNSDPWNEYISLLELFGGLFLGVILLWLGSRLKSKNKQTNSTTNSANSAPANTPSAQQPP